LFPFNIPLLLQGKKRREIEVGSNKKTTEYLEIKKRLDAIETHLKKFKSKPLNAVDAAEYLSISLQHLYRLTSQRKIPFHKPSNRYIYFFEHELNEWICSNEKLKITNEKLEEDEEEEPP